jgi:hypothetical protein
MKIEAEIEIEKVDCEGNVLDVFPVLVEGEYTPACKGSRDYYGKAIEPDTCDELEFVGATDSEGGEFELCKEDIYRAVQALWENVGGASEDF